MTEQMKQALHNEKIRNMAAYYKIDFSKGECDVYNVGFADGLFAYLNNLWHDANKEQPKLGSSVLISKDWKHFEVSHSILRVYEDRFWCYIEDLFPTREEERK